MSLTSSQRDLAFDLFDIQAIQFGAFRLKLHETQPDAPPSPIFLNLRTPDNPKPGPLTPVIMTKIGRELHRLVREKGLTFTRIAGIPNAGDPFVAALGRSMRLAPESFITFEKVTGQGNRRITRVSGGTYNADEALLLIDDLITQADTKLEAITAAHQAGLVVKNLLVLVDRQQGGRQQLAQAGCELHAAFTLVDLMEFYVQGGYVDASKRDEVMAYLKANSA